MSHRKDWNQEHQSSSEVYSSRESSNAEIVDMIDERLRILMKEGAYAPVETSLPRPELPPYYDADRFHQGQQAFYNNMFTMMVGKLCGLLTLLTIPSILDVIIFTKQSGTPCTAFRRYVSTILHTFIWYKKKPLQENEFLNSLRSVRKKHCVAFKRSLEAGLQRVSQMDMMLAQFGFIGFTLTNGEQLGVFLSDEELDGLVHFWRVIGNVLGLEDKYNLCMETVEETRAFSVKILNEIFLPSLASRSKSFDEMGRILLEGLWPVMPHLNTQAFIAFTLQLAKAGATNNNHSIVIDIANMSAYSKFMLRTQLFVHRSLMPPRYWWSSWFRAIFNWQIRVAIFLMENFPFLAYWKFGKKLSHVDIYGYY